MDWIIALILGYLAMGVMLSFYKNHVPSYYGEGLHPPFCWKKFFKEIFYSPIVWLIMVLVQMIKSATEKLAKKWRNRNCFYVSSRS